MKVTIKPSIVRGTVIVPPSKSAAHRALISAALSGGCTVSSVGNSADIDATGACLKVLGAQTEQTEQGIRLGGLDPYRIPDCTLDCGESGSTLRFLIPLCLVSGSKVTFKGQGRLMQRPLGEYAEFCRQKGFLFDLQPEHLTISGKMTGGEFYIDGSRSSQFITGMLFVLPLLEGESTLVIEGEAQSLSYIDLTLQILRDFGIEIKKQKNRFFIPGGQRYRAEHICVEGDWSNAAFPAALNVLGGEVRLEGLREDSTQGDKIYREYFEKLGKETLDLSDCPDLAPILFALAAVRGGSFKGCKRLRLKESDRIAAMQAELQKCGITLVAGEDDVCISPEGLHPPTLPIVSHNDHRIVMAMTVLLSHLGGSIEGAEAVGKSWRDFFETMRKLGMEVEYAS